MRTPAWVWVVTLLILGASVALLSPIIKQPHLFTAREPIVWVVFAMCAGLPVLMLTVMRPYLVSAPAIALYADRLVVPNAWRGSSTFPFATLKLEQVRILQNVSVMAIPTGAQLDRGIRLTLRADGVHRTISDRIFAEPEALRWLLADVATVARGEPARGYDAWKTVAMAELRDEGDDHYGDD